VKGLFEAALEGGRGNCRTKSLWGGKEAEMVEISEKPMRFKLGVGQKNFHWTGKKGKGMPGREGPSFPEREEADLKRK